MRRLKFLLLKHEKFCEQLETCNTAIYYIDTNVVLENKTILNKGCE